MAHGPPPPPQRTLRGVGGVIGPPTIHLLIKEHEAAVVIRISRHMFDSLAGIFLADSQIKDLVFEI